jgi:hypothetical protein
MSITLFPKKISTQTMRLALPELEAAAAQGKGKPVPVLRVWGIVSSAVPGTSQYGNYHKFGGEIAALNLITGEEARSQNLLLPGVAEGVVKSLFDKAAKIGGAAQIGIEIAVEENISAKGGTKFKWVVKPLFEYKGDDALAEMAKTLPAPVFFKALTPPAAKK